MIDFNNDGMADAKITQLEPVAPSVEPVFTIQLLPEAVGKLAQKFTISPDFGPYKSITFKLNASSESPQNYYTVTATAEKGGSADGGLVAAEGATATLKATPAEGYEFDGWYEANTKVSSSLSYSFTVTRNITLTARFYALPAKITASNVSVFYGENKSIEIKVYDIEKKTINNAEVTCYFNGNSEKKITNANGVATYLPKSSLVPKEYVLSVECAGVKTTSKYTVKKAKLKLSAPSKKTFKSPLKKKKISVTLKNKKGKAIKNLKVTITVKNKKYTAKTDKKGKAILKITKLTKKGTYTATVKYVGDKYYDAVSKKIKIIIK